MGRASSWPVRACSSTCSGVTPNSEKTLWGKPSSVRMKASRRLQFVDPAPSASVHLLHHLRVEPHKVVRLCGTASDAFADFLRDDPLDHPHVDVDRAVGSIDEELPQKACPTRARHRRGLSIVKDKAYNKSSRIQALPDLRRLCPLSKADASVLF